MGVQETEHVPLEQRREKHAKIGEVWARLQGLGEGIQKARGSFGKPGLRAATVLDGAESLRHFVTIDPYVLYADGDPDEWRWRLRHVLRVLRDTDCISGDEYRAMY